jgi:Ca2+-binding EF-hand superfamily protein
MMPRHSLISQVAVIGFFVLSPVVAVADSASLGKENFRQADVDDDGQLVYAEFATFIDLNAADGLGNAAMVSSRGMHARAFKRVDADGDGIVTPEELQAMR